MAGYRQFHGFAAAPFSKAISRKHLLVYPQLEELHGELDELIDEGAIGILTGEMGIGKTTALRHYLHGLEERSCQVAYQGSSRHSTAILEGIVEWLGVQPARLRSALLRQIGNLVQRSWHEQRKKTLVVIDDAHLLEDGLLEDLRLLTNFEMDCVDPLVLLLVGHPALRLRLGRPVHLALLDRVRLQYRLEGLSREETGQYIDCHLQYAGASSEIFNTEAKSAIFEHAQGIPRRINALALACLKKSASRKLKRIDAGLVTATLKLMAKD